jgi:hypothetical protein
MLRTSAVLHVTARFPAEPLPDGVGFGGAVARRNLRYWIALVLSYEYRVA